MDPGIMGLGYGLFILMEEFLIGNNYKNFNHRKIVSQSLHDV